MHRKIIVIIKEKKRRITSSIERACWSQARELCTSPYTYSMPDCRSLFLLTTAGLGAQCPLIFCIQNPRSLWVISQGASRKTFSHPVSTCWSTRLFCLEGKLHTGKTFWSFLTPCLVLMSRWVKFASKDLSLLRDPNFLLLPVNWSLPQTTKLQDRKGILSLNHKSSL